MGVGLGSAAAAGRNRTVAKGPQQGQPGDNPVQTDKLGFIGPIVEAGNIGIPSLLGYALGKSSTPDLEKDVDHKYSIPHALLIPGYTGYHYGIRESARAKKET